MQGFTRAMQLELYELLGIGPGSGSLELAMDTYGPWVGLMGHRGNDCGLVDDIGYSGHFFFWNLRSKSKCWPMFYIYVLTHRIHVCHIWSHLPSIYPQC